MSTNKNLSPYKAVKTQNLVHVSYVNIENLIKNKPYLVYLIEPTEHPQYGHGERAFLRGSGHEKWKTQLPNKYLKVIGDQVQTFKDDISCKKYPFLVYRAKLLDGSYHIDMLEFSTDLLKKHKRWEDIPLSESPNSSLDSVDALLASVSDGETEKGTEADGETPSKKMKTK